MNILWVWFVVFILLSAQFSINIECFPFCADVIYDPEIILVLIGMLQKLSTSRADRKPPEVYVASTIRNPDTYHLFQAELGRCLFCEVYQ